MHIIVTGSSSGLGAELVKAAGRWRHTVGTFDLRAGQDVADPGGFAPTTVDALINCAGINQNQWFEDITRDDFEKVMSVNAWGMVAMTQCLLPQLKASKGTVINIVSNASHIPMTSSLSYNASKAAGAMITRQMAHELTPKYGITVFSVSPNKLAGTSMSKQIEANVLATRGWTPEHAREYQSKALMHGRESDPAMLADFIIGLLSDGHHDYLSGCDIPYGK
jgi:NAD(P)-dependent dehydrogenase (short-subunit alcohol dehydrogenase family)